MLPAFTYTLFPIVTLGKIIEPALIYVSFPIVQGPISEHNGPIFTKSPIIVLCPILVLL